MRQVPRVLTTAALSGLMIAAPLAGPLAARSGGSARSYRPRCVAIMQGAIARFDHLAGKVERNPLLDAAHRAALLADFEADVAALVEAKDAVAEATTPAAVRDACRAARAQARARWNLEVSKTRMMTRAEALSDRISALAERVEALIAEHGDLLAGIDGFEAVMDMLEGLLSDTTADLADLYDAVLDLDLADLDSGEAYEVMEAARHLLGDIGWALGRADDVLPEIVDALPSMSGPEIAALVRSLLPELLMPR